MNKIHPFTAVCLAGAIMLVGSVFFVMVMNTWEQSESKTFATAQADRQTAVYEAITTQVVAKMTATAAMGKAETAVVQVAGTPDTNTYPCALPEGTRAWTWILSPEKPLNAGGATFSVQDHKVEVDQAGEGPWPLTKGETVELGRFNELCFTLVQSNLVIVRGSPEIAPPLQFPETLPAPAR